MTDAQYAECDRCGHAAAVDEIDDNDRCDRCAQEVAEDDGPSDDQLYNRPGMEGGIPYDTRYSS